MDSPVSPDRIARFSLTRLMGTALAVTVALLMMGLVEDVMYGDLHFGLAIAVAIVVHFAYLGFVRRVERRRATELSIRDSFRETAQGIGIGVALTVATIPIMALQEYDLELYRWPVHWLPEIAFAPAVAYVEGVVLLGLLFRNVEKSFGSWIALLLVSAVFGFTHLTDPTLADLLAVSMEAGFLLGAAYLLTRRFWLAVGIHSVWHIAWGMIDASTGHIVHGSAPPITGSGLGAQELAVALALGVGTSSLFLREAGRKGHFIAPFWRRAGRTTPGETDSGLDSGAQLAEVAEAPVREEGAGPGQPGSPNGAAARPTASDAMRWQRLLWCIRIIVAFLAIQAVLILFRLVAGGGRRLGSWFAVPHPVFRSGDSLRSFCLHRVRPARRAAPGYRTVREGCVTGIGHRHLRRYGDHGGQRRDHRHAWKLPGDRVGAVERGMVVDRGVSALRVCGRGPLPRRAVPDSRGEPGDLDCLGADLVVVWVRAHYGLSHGVQFGCDGHRSGGVGRRLRPDSSALARSRRPLRIALHPGGHSRREPLRAQDDRAL